MKVKLLVLVTALAALAVGALLRPLADKYLLLRVKNMTPSQDQNELELAELEEHEDHIALSQDAFENLKLILQPIEYRDYEKAIRIPGEVAEIPGISSRELTSPVNGIVTEMTASPGAIVGQGHTLFRVHVTDERLIDAQLELLQAIEQLKVIESELKRLEPLADSGAVAGRKRLELQYERQKLTSRITLTQQELVVRGLPAKQVSQLQETRQLVNQIEVGIPRASKPNELSKPAIGRTAEASDTTIRVGWLKLIETDQKLTIEKILVVTGQSVARGQTLCKLADHQNLFIEGHAFESEIKGISQAAALGFLVAAEFGTQGQMIHENLPIRYVANHVDAQTQTYQVFAALPNEITQVTSDQHGHSYRDWRYKVGQRVHLVIPTEKLAQQLVVPADAVVLEGPNAFVFRVHQEEDSSDTEIHEEEEIEKPFVELEPVAVTVIQRDVNTVVLKKEKLLRLGDTIAMNSAYELYLALIAEAEGGGHHHHHH